jgi:Na+-transporting NADH:ubiquinone oxidoreductase subunit A
LGLHRTTKGLDLPLAGAPAQEVEPARAVTRVGLMGADSIGLKASMLVQPGARVAVGDPLFEDKRAPALRYVAPASGVVEAIHRGERRAFVSLVIAIDGLDDSRAFASFSGKPIGALDGAEVRALLLESGSWSALRERPFSNVPLPDAVPRSLFVTATDSHPHAPRVATALAGREQDFSDGVAALAKLLSGNVYVCTDAGSALPVPSDRRIVVEQFAGPHPAGTVGWHIHRLDPVDHERRVWHVGYADVAAIGHLFRTGRLDVARIVSLAGPGAARPRLLRTRLGASLDELTGDELRIGPQRVVSGSVLGGRTAMGEIEGYLGRYHRQIAVVPEATERRMFGYIAPGRDKFSIFNVVLGRLRGEPLALDTSTNGGPRAMVPIGSYERVMPMDLMPTFLLRALFVGDLERAEALGVLELDEEDLALATFVDPGKTEWGPLLREMLTRMAKEHA